MRVVPEGVVATVHRVRVGYADTDQGGVVHHATYLRYLESARIEHLRERGLDYRSLELDQRLALPVIEANVRYRISARFDDLLQIHTFIGMVSRAKVRFDSVIRRGDETLTVAQITLVCIRLPEGRICSIPASIQALATSPS